MSESAIKYTKKEKEIIERIDKLKSFLVRSLKGENVMASVYALIETASEIVPNDEMHNAMLADICNEVLDRRNTGLEN